MSNPTTEYTISFKGRTFGSKDPNEAESYSNRVARVTAVTY